MIQYKFYTDVSKTYIETEGAYFIGNEQEKYKLCNQAAIFKAELWFILILQVLRDVTIAILQFYVIPRRA